MKTVAHVFSLLLLTVALPGFAQAQPVTDTVTGVDSPPPGMSMAVPAMKPEMIKDYIRALEAVDMAVDYETGGAARRELGVDRLKIDARWERRPGETSATLRGLEIRPESGRMTMGGMSVNKVTIDERGVMKLDIHRFPDLTVRKITRDADGNVRLHIDWFPDVTIKADGAVKLFGIGVGKLDGNPLGAFVSNWPPSLETVMDALMKPTTPPTPRATGTTAHDGTIRWDVKGRSSPTEFKLGPDGLAVRAASDFHIRGAGVLESDGTFRTIGNGNQAKVHVHVGGSRVAGGPLGATVNRGDATFEGRYGVSIPAGRSDRLALDVDGKVSYSVDGSDVTLNLPSGTRLRAGDVDVAGDGRLTMRVAPGRGASVVLRDGTYRLDSNGPISITGLRTRGLTTEELGFEGRVHSEGSFAPAGNGLALRGSATADVTATGPGIVDVLTGDASLRGTVREGSRVRADVEEFSASTTVDADGRFGLARGASARGRVEGGLELGDVAASTSTASVTAERVHVDVNGGFDASDAGLTSANGSVRARLDGPANVTARIPGGAPGGLGEATRHRVVSGDTLSGIARRYRTTVPALKAANGLTGDTIRVGDSLTIPGTGSAPRPTSPDTSVTTTVAPGSEVAVDVRSARTTPAGLEVDGHITAKVRVTDAEVRGGQLQAKILGAARASLDADFSLRPGANGAPVVRTGTVRVPVRIDFGRGSRVQVNVPGQEVDVVMDRDGSYAEFTAVARLDETGVRLDELAACDVLLVSGGNATFGGRLVEVPGEKTLRYAGRVVVRPNGFDVYGDLQVGVRGPADRPIIRIRTN